MSSISIMDEVSSEDVELHPRASEMGATSSSHPTEAGSSCQPLQGTDNVSDNNNNTEVEATQQMASPAEDAPVSPTDMDVDASTNDIVIPPAPAVCRIEVVPDPGTESSRSYEEEQEDGKQLALGEQGVRIPVKDEAVEESIDIHNVTVKAESQSDTEANNVMVKAEAQNDDTEANYGTVDAEVQNDDTEVNDSPDLVQDAPRWSSTTIGTYAIQCNTCWKWRVIPTKEQYETLGENILEKPFVCEDARTWREDAKCEDPSDLEDDEPTILWAVDKHNIPCPPQGFYRKVVLRGENSKKFADIYYKAPCGKTLRSMVQVQKYLEEAGLGLNISQFCFTSPKPRPGVIKPAPGVVQKRPLKVMPEPPRKRMKGSIQAPTSNPGSQQAHLNPQPGTKTLPLAKSRELSPPTPNAAGEERMKVEESSEAVMQTAPNPLMAVKQEVVKPEIEEDEFMEDVKPSVDPAEPATITLEQPS